MNKSELIKAVSDDAGIPKSVAGAVIDSMIRNIKKSLRKGNAVTIIGFGSFKVTKRAARIWRNPKTGETIKIKARKSPRFVAGKGLKDALS